MIDLKDYDPSFTFFQQLDQIGGGPITLIDTIVVPEGGMQAVLDAWQKDSFVMRAKPGFISAQLYRGVGDSKVVTNVAVWESAADLKNAFMSREFQELLPLYPDGSVAYPVLTHQAAIPGVCVA